MREQRGGLFRGTSGVARRARGIAPGQGRGMVPGQGRERARPGVARLLDGARHAQVQAAAPRRRDLVVERLPEQRVAEAVGAGLRQRFQHPRLQGLFQRAQAGVLVHVLQHAQEQARVELAPDGGRAGEHLVGRFGQPIEPPPDHLLDAFGDALRRPAARLHRRAEQAFLQQQARHLAHEQGIAFGASVHLVGQCGGHLRAGGTPHHAHRAGAVQPAQPQPLEGCFGRQRRQRAGQGMLPR